MTTLSALAGALSLPANVLAGAFMFSSSFPDTIALPSGYDGNGGNLNVGVCITPGSPFARDMEQPVRNAIATWNRLQPSTGNLRPGLTGNRIDFQSVAVHEIGHCIGQAHPNLGFLGSSLADKSEFTASNPGPNGQINAAAGADGLPGTADDIRGDDENVFWFRRSNNNPFSLAPTVDAQTYSRDPARLPGGDLFPANAERNVSTLARYQAGLTESVMQQGTTTGEIQHTLGHDDVATAMLAMSGLDRTAGTADDVTFQMNYLGITQGAACDITLAMNSAETGFAVCQTQGNSPDSQSYMTIEQGRVFFNPEINWAFNAEPPCSESFALPANQWKQIALPCDVGISTGNTLAEVFGDDLTGVNGRDWVMWVWEYSTVNGTLTGAYRRLQNSDTLQSGMGYWLQAQNATTLDVSGEYPSQLDVPMLASPSASVPGRDVGYNMIGMPFRFPTVWADAQVINAEGEVLSLLDTDPVSTGATACTGDSQQSAFADCRFSSIAYVWNDAADSYDLLTRNSGTLKPFDAAWVLAGENGLALRVPMSPQERTTP